MLFVRGVAEEELDFPSRNTSTFIGGCRKYTLIGRQPRLIKEACLCSEDCNSDFYSDKIEMICYSNTTE